MTKEQLNALAEKITKDAITRNQLDGLTGAITLFNSVAVTYQAYGNPLPFQPDSDEDMYVTSLVNSKLEAYSEEKLANENGKSL